MKNNDFRIIIENQQSDFSYKKSKSNLNITFNRVSFIFFVFFVVCLIFFIHLIHLGSRKDNIHQINNLEKISSKLYRADFIDRNGKFIGKTVSSIDI